MLTASRTEAHTHQANSQLANNNRCQQGIIRLSTVENESHPEITVALMSSLDDCKFCHPGSENLQIEAITDCIIKINNEQKVHAANDDFLQEWIFRLYTVRHPIKSEDRLKSLLQTFNYQAWQTNPRRLQASIFTISFSTRRDDWYDKVNSEPIARSTEGQGNYFDR
jgi:hypothetical protein